MEQPNFSQIDQITGGDDDFKQQLLAVIHKEFPVEQQQYFDCLSSNNFKGLAEIVHKLKHKISILGLEKSYAIAVEYEHALREETFVKKEDFECVLAVISNFLNTLKKEL